MNLIYLANLRLPTEKAHGLQIIKTCEAFTNQGVNLRLIIPRRRQVNPHLAEIKDPFTYYQVTTRFPIVKLPCLDLLSIYIKLPKAISHWPYYLQELTFDLSCLIQTFFHHSDYYFTRSFPLAALLSLFCPNKTIFELHNLPSSPISQHLYRLIFPRLTIVAINHYLTIHSSRLKAHRTILAPDAASPEDFHLPSKTQARQKLHLPPRDKIILYTGSFQTNKGVYTLAQSSRYLNSHTHIYLLGGSSVDRQIQPLQQFIQNHQLKNIHLINQFIPHQQLPLYRAAADVLVIPNSSKDPRSALYTSPLKLFQYLASGRPIVASHVPAIQEIVSRKQVFFFRPDNPQSLAQTVQKVLDSPTKAKQKTSHARQLARQFTWSSRTETILNYLNQ